MAQKTANTFAELRAVAPADSKSVYVFGKDAKFDGFGGIFIRRPQTDPSQVDDDASILVSTADPSYYWRLWR